MAVTLVVDDQPNMRRSTAILLEQDGHSVLQAGGIAEALQLIAGTDVDVVVSDVRMDGPNDGSRLLQAVRGERDDVQVVLMTAFGTIDDAVGAIKAGAYDYLTKPLDPARLLITIRRAAERCGLARELKHLRAQVGDGNTIIGASRAMQSVLGTVRQLAQTDSTVLITGESGTGKELIARALHAQSARRTGKFVPINCGAMADTLMESELFGHRKGSFTGAVSDKKGLLEEAHKGVLFLDEIGEMPASMQVRLLRFLQGGEIRRIGDTQERRVDVRLVLATHRALEAEVAEGRFRDDFYYRINVVGITIPPLRDRPEDIRELADYYLRRFAAQLRRPVHGFAPDALNLLVGYRWPGNVRELANAIERAVNLASGTTITAADLPAALTLAPDPPPRIATRPSQALERARLVEALTQCHWNHRRAAEVLGISRTTLWRRLRELQIGA